MNKVTTVNLNGNAYQLEESGYEALHAYLDAAARRLESNPDKDEIIADIEQAIAEKFRAILGAHKSVVATKEVEQIVTEMGPVEDSSAPADDSADIPFDPQRSSRSDASAPPGSADPSGSATSARKRLYKFSDGAMIGGVCNGLAVYFGIDVTIVRLVFALLTFFWGVGPIVYIVMLIIVPKAQTPAEKATAGGIPPTAQDFIRRAKAGYYEGMKTFGDRRAQREWKRKFKREMRGWKRDFQQEMNEHATELKHNWHRYWGPPYQPHTGSWVALSLLSLVRGLLALVAAAVAISLVTTHAVFGFALPPGLPLWAALVLLFIVYKLIAWPFKAMRWIFCSRADYLTHPAVQLLGFVQCILWLGFTIILIGFVSHHLPQIRVAIENLPATTHQAADSVKRWWARQ
jgi:phage shock protein PspC (stress-responsive transcriptional regulator)